MENFRTTKPSSTQYHILTKEDEMKLNVQKVAHHKQDESNEKETLFQNHVGTKYNEENNAYELYQSDLRWYI